MSTKSEVLVQFDTQLTTSRLTRPANTNAYSGGDAISDTAGDAHLTFSGALRPGGGRLSGSIPTAICTSSANQSGTALPDLELWLFHTDIATVADADPFTITDAEMDTLVGIIDFPVASWKVGDPTTGTGNAVCVVNNLGLVIQGAGPDLYGQLVVRNAYTPVASEIFTCRLLMTQD